jgi:hypothetical protein
MKLSTALGACALGSFLLPQVASATLLVGFRDFDATANTQTVTPSSTNNFALTGFSGSIVKTVVSEDAGGSNDNRYGNSDIAVLPGTPTVAQTQDGHGKAQSGKNLTFAVTNSTSADVALGALLFDAAYRDVATTTLGVAYKIGAGELVTLSGNVGPMIQSYLTYNQPVDYTDFVLNLTGVTLGMGQTISFVFSIAAGAGASTLETVRLDNIALTAIPEPASLVALGCLLGSGMFLRQRRRASAAPLQVA